MVNSIPKFKSSIRALKMVRDAIKQQVNEEYDTLTEHQIELLNYRISEMNEAIKVLETYTEQ